MVAVLERFIEVYVDCPLEVCAARDPKGTFVFTDLSFSVERGHALSIIAERHTPALLPGFVDSLAELEVGLAIAFEARYERALSRL